MVSKREKKRYFRFIAEQAKLLEMEHADLEIKRLKFARRQDRTALRLSRKNKKQADSWVI